MFIALVGVASQIATLSRAFAAGLQSAPQIFDVRRSLPLDPAEPVYHDFYINAGAEAGFKKGWMFNVVRVIPVHDPIQNKQQGELQVNVARLQVLQVAATMTVARLISEFTDEERPALDFESVMIGDRADISTLTAEVPKPPPKKKMKAAKADAEVESEELHADIGASQGAGQAASSLSSSATLAEASGQSGQSAPSKVSEGGQQTMTAPEGVPPVVENASPVAKSPDMVRVPVPSSSAAGKL